MYQVQNYVYIPVSLYSSKYSLCEEVLFVSRQCIISVPKICWEKSWNLLCLGSGNWQPCEPPIKHAFKNACPNRSTEYSMKLSLENFQHTSFDKKSSCLLFLVMKQHKKLHEYDLGFGLSVCATQTSYNWETLAWFHVRTASSVASYCRIV